MTDVDNSASDVAAEHDRRDYGPHDETPLDTAKAKRKKTANVASVSFILDTVLALPSRQYSPADKDKLRAIARKALLLENMTSFDN